MHIMVLLAVEAIVTGVGTKGGEDKWGLPWLCIIWISNNSKEKNGIKVMTYKSNDAMNNFSIQNFFILKYQQQSNMMPERKDYAGVLIYICNHSQISYAINLLKK